MGDVLFNLLRRHYSYPGAGPDDRGPRCACDEWFKWEDDPQNRGHAGHVAEVISAHQRVAVLTPSELAVMHEAAKRDADDPDGNDGVAMVRAVEHILTQRSAVSEHAR